MCMSIYDCRNVYVYGYWYMLSCNSIALAKDGVSLLIQHNYGLTEKVLKIIVRWNEAP